MTAATTGGGTPGITGDGARPVDPTTVDVAAVLRGCREAVGPALREAIARIAQDPAFQEQCRTQFTELDYLDGPAWRARLAEADGRFRQMWQRHPWAEA